MTLIFTSFCSSIKRKKRGPNEQIWLIFLNIIGPHQFEVVISITSDKLS